MDGVSGNRDSATAWHAMRTIPGWVKPSRRHGSITSSGYLRALDGKGVAVAAPNREWYRRLEMAEVLAFVTDRRREDLTLDFKVVAGNFAHFSAEPVAGSRTPGTRGRSKEALGSITIGMSLNRQVLLARSVATMLPRPGSTRGDSRRLEGTTAWLERDDRQRLSARSPLPSLT